MNFKLEQALEILERTPATLESLLIGLSNDWLVCNEGEGTWNASEVVGHLIEGERTNWIPRLKWLLREGESQPFPPFDRYSHVSAASTDSIDSKLSEFKAIRLQNTAKLRTLIDSEELLESIGAHPAFGAVKARELVATWAVHDLTHIAQIVRVLAERYRQDVGPWVAYLGILNRS